jgi:hypothetical protein
MALVSAAAVAANGPSRAPQGAGESLWLPSRPLPEGEYFERTEMTTRPDGTQLLMRFDTNHPNGVVLNSSEGKECEAMAVNTLRNAAPNEARIYDLLKEKSTFVFFLKCSQEEFVSSLPSAAHEASHGLTSQTGGYYLLNGTFLKTVEDDEGFMPPSKIRPLVDANDEKVQRYINGEPEGSSGRFWILLDEFNAYTHSLETTLRLPLQTMVPYERYSLLSMMKFVKLYAEVARSQSPQTYRALIQTERRHVIQVLWAQAQALLEKSCRHTRRQSDEVLFADVYKTSDARGLAEVLGAYPAYPATCR